MPPPPPTEEEEARARVLEECGGGTDMYPRPANIREMTGKELEEYHRDLAKARADEVTPLQTIRKICTPFLTSFLQYTSPNLYVLHATLICTTTLTP